MGAIARVLFALTYLACGFTAWGQVTWMCTYGGMTINEGSCVRALPDGGSIVCGSTGSFGNGSSDAYVLHLGIDGTPVRTGVFGGEGVDQARGLALLPGGACWVVGFTNSSGNGGYDGLLLRLDAAGDPTVERAVGASDWEFLYGVQATSDGGAFAVGTTYATENGEPDVWLLRVDADGRTLWSEHYGTVFADEGRSLVVTPDGGCVLAGWTTVSDGTTDALVMKVDADGTREWTTVVSTPGNDAGAGICRTADGGYVLGGTSGAMDDFQVLLLAKLNDAGEVQWSRDIGSGTDWGGGEVRERPDGGLVMTGWTKAHGAGASDVYLLRTDAMGEFEFGSTFGGVIDDLGVSLDLLPGGGFQVAGSTTSFGPGMKAVFVIRTDALGQTADLVVTEFSDPLSVKAPPVPEQWSVSPNPVASGGTIRFAAGKGDRSTAYLFDPHGRNVAALSVRSDGSMRIPEVASGLYAVLVYGGDGVRRMARLVIEP